MSRIIRVAEPDFEHDSETLLSVEGDVFPAGSCLSATVHLKNRPPPSTTLVSASPAALERSVPLRGLRGGFSLNAVSLEDDVFARMP